MTTINTIVISTIDDLKAYREAASDILIEIARETTGRHWIKDNSMEHQLQIGIAERPLAVSKRWVDESEWIILIVGFAYGTVVADPEAEGCSITECEYRHAASSDKKKVFVFVAGDETYQASHAEDLRRAMRASQPQASRDSLARFRGDLERALYLSQFDNLALFREQLRATLRKAVNDLPSVQAGTPLAKLIRKVTPAIQDFTRKVARITHCKEVHDRLHDVRRHVICPTREQLVPCWLRDGVLSNEMRHSLNMNMARLAKHTGALETLSRLPGPDEGMLRALIAKTIALSQFWLEAEEPIADPNDFAEKFDKLTGAAEKAFREADASMKKEADSLRVLYMNLKDEIDIARGSSALSEEDNTLLSKNLKAFREMTDHLCQVFEVHNAWQGVHNELVLLDNLRGNSKFEGELESFSNSSLNTLLSLLDGHNRLVQQAPHLPGSLDSTAPSTGKPTRQPPDLQELKSSFEALRVTSDDETFIGARNPFDVAFYWVDKQTLCVVEQMSSQAKEIERRVDDLNRSDRSGI